MTTKSGKLNYTSKFYKFRGNKNFSSTNPLLDNDTKPFDDIKSIFYLLIYFLNREVTRKKSKKQGEILKKKKIVEIRKKTNPLNLCNKFPESFKVFLLK